MTFTHQRFDRHSLFSSTDRSLVLNIMGKVSPADHPNSSVDHLNVVNMLYGLFDGYWYIGLKSALLYVKGIPPSMHLDLCELLSRVSKVSKPSDKS